MSVLPIVRAGDPVLRMKAAPVPDEDIGSPGVQALIADMIDTMRAAPGVGLAAPQVGRSVRILVAEDPADAVERLSAPLRDERGRMPLPLHVMINPELRVVGAERRTFPEGCLSVPGYSALVERSLAIEVRWRDQDGAAHDWTIFTGWPARILQHEVDHLDGILYTDRMLARSFMTDEHMRRHAGERPIADMRRELGL